MSAFRELIENLVIVLKDYSVKFVDYDTSGYMNRNQYILNFHLGSYKGDYNSIVGKLVYWEQLCSVHVYYHPIGEDPIMTIPTKMLNDYKYLELCASQLKIVEATFEKLT